MSDDLEKEIALYEAERNRAWHSWFANRGDVSPSDEHTRIFDGGFRMAWELWRAQPAPQPAEQQPAPDVAALVTLLEHARCNTCDGSGALYDGHGQVRQCQWCHERSEALAAHRKQGEKHDYQD